MFRYIVFAVIVAGAVAAITSGIVWLWQWRIKVLEARAQKYQDDEELKASKKIKVIVGKNVR